MSQFIGNRLQILENEVNSLLQFSERKKTKSPFQLCDCSPKISMTRSHSSGSLSSSPCSKKSNKSSIPVRVKKRVPQSSKSSDRRDTRWGKTSRHFSDNSFRPRRRNFLSPESSTGLAGTEKLVDIYPCVSMEEEYCEITILKDGKICPGRQKLYNKKSQTTCMPLICKVASKNAECDPFTCDPENCVLVEKGTETVNRKRKCDCKKRIEEWMKIANRTIENLQAQIITSDKSLQLLTAARQFLSDVITVIKLKYYQKKKEIKHLKAQNENLKNQNLELAEKLVKNHERCNKNHCCQDSAKRVIKQNAEMKILLARAEVEKEELMKQIKQQNEQLDMVGKENKKLNSQLQNESDISMKYITKFEEKIKRVISLGEYSQNETKTLRSIVQGIRTKSTDNKKQNEIEEMKRECADLKQQLLEMKQQDQSRCLKIEEELYNFMIEITRNEKIVEKERNEVLSIINDLSNVISAHKNRIDQLLRLNKQQEGLLFSQSSLLKRKEEELLLAEETTESVKKKSHILEKQIENLQCSIQTIETLRNSIENKKCNCGLDIIENDLKLTRSSLKDEKDRVLIKDKIIQDQADTIQKLKCNIEIQRSSTELASADVNSLLMELQSERETKNQLLIEIKDLEWQKDLLEDEIELLKNQDGNGDAQETKIKLKEYHELISQLEKQVANKQKEWQQHYYMLKQENCEALEVARYVTKKLIETVKDFEGHSESHRDLHSQLTDLIERRSESLTLNSNQTFETCYEEFFDSSSDTY